MQASAWARVELARSSDVLARAPRTTYWLSPSEQQRLATLKHAMRRAQFLAGHWLLREMLACIHGACPSLIALDQSRGRPPQPAGDLADVLVSLSHAEEWIAAAVSNQPIGVDIEPVDRQLDRSLEPLLRDPSDAAAPLDANERLERWVVKEAYLKARGESALPQQLAGLELERVPVDASASCDGVSPSGSVVRVANTGTCLLAVCSEPSAPIWNRMHLPVSRYAWRVQGGSFWALTACRAQLGGPRAAA